MTQVASNAHRVEIVAASGSALSTLAASMSSGQWANFTMTGLTEPLLHAISTAGTQSYVTFSHGGVWDAINKRIFFLGIAHVPAGSANTGGIFTWDDATNVASRPATYAFGAGQDFGAAHTYQHVAYRPTGEIYWRIYSTNVIRKYVGPSGSSNWQNDWATGYVADKGTGANQITGALLWYPQLNGGAGGLVFADQVGVQWTNAALSSWQYQSGTALSGGYDTNAALAGGYVYFGGGTSGATSAFYRMDSSGNVIPRAALPAIASQNSAGAGVLLSHPSESNNLLLLQMNPGATTYKYTASTDSWASVGANGLTESLLHMPTVIPDYGVIVVVTHGGTQTTAYCKVYKP